MNMSTTSRVISAALIALLAALVGCESVPVAPPTATDERGAFPVIAGFGMRDGETASETPEEEKSYEVDGDIGGVFDGHRLEIQLPPGAFQGKGHLKVKRNDGSASWSVRLEGVPPGLLKKPARLIVHLDPADAQTQQFLFAYDRGSSGWTAVPGTQNVKAGTFVAETSRITTDFQLVSTDGPVQDGSAGW